MNILQTSQNTIEIISKANDQYISNKVELDHNVQGIALFKNIIIFSLFAFRADSIKDKYSLHKENIPSVGSFLAKEKYLLKVFIKFVLVKIFNSELVDKSAMEVRTVSSTTNFSMLLNFLI